MNDGDENKEVVHCDQLILFCRDFVSRYPEQRVTEALLATHFVLFFELPPIADISNLTEFCNSVGIALSKETLPPDLIGINGSVGNLRKIIISERVEDLCIQEHTLLHEIRELIEHVFRDLGSSISTPEEMEARASEFASFVMTSSYHSMFESWERDVAGIESPWQLILAALIIGAAQMLVAVRAHMSAHNPRLRTL
jgi:hypothetical protein